MVHTRMRIAAASVILLLPVSIGAIAAHASPACQRLVHKYVAMPVRNRVSKVTALAWKQWGIAHPNWKPSPHTNRPKYLLTQEEVVSKVDFACQVQRAYDGSDPFDDGEDYGHPITNVSMTDPTPIAMPRFLLPHVDPEDSSTIPDPSEPTVTATLGEVFNGTPGGDMGGASGDRSYPGYGGGGGSAPGSFGGAFGGGSFGGANGGGQSASDQPTDLPTATTAVTPEPSSLSLLALSLCLFAFSLPKLSVLIAARQVPTTDAE